MCNLLWFQQYLQDEVLLSTLDDPYYSELKVHLDYFVILV